MKKAFPYILLAALAVAAWAFTAYITKTSQEEIEHLKNEIQKDKAERDSLNGNLKQLEEELKKKEVTEVINNKMIDSLQALIDVSGDKPCEHQLDLHKKQNTALKGALRTCNEQKAIQTKVINTYKGLVINHEVTCPKEIKLATAECEQKGRFWKWVAAGGWAVALLLLI